MYPTEAYPPQPERTYAPGTLFFRLVVPVTELGMGLFRFDPLEKLLGAPLAHFLEPAMRGPSVLRPSANGPAVNVYPLHIPPGEGVSIRLGQWGDIGFANDQGFLRIIAPLIAAEWLRQRMARWMVRGPERALSVDQTAWNTVVWVRLDPGMAASIPMPGVGEVGVEVG